MAATRVRGSVESGDYVAVGMLDGACWIAGLMKDLDGLSVGLLGGWLEHVNPISASVPLLCHAVLCRPPPPPMVPSHCIECAVLCCCCAVLCPNHCRTMPFRVVPCSKPLCHAALCRAVQAEVGRH